jgi:hypothetical protein
MARVLAVSAATLALLGSLLIGAGRLSTGALHALARVGLAADCVDTGARIVPLSATSSVPDENAGEDSSGTSQTDLQGDEVSPALATYGIDRDGNLFEVHSPHTEVPRLPGPTT